MKVRTMVKPNMKFFDFEHLPPHLRAVSAPIRELADEIDSSIPEGPEKDAGLRKLLEAKDCFVRASIVPGRREE